MEKVASVGLTAEGGGKVKRRKFVNKNGGANHRITIDLVSSTNVGQSRT
jgi:hypothetical protein